MFASEHEYIYIYTYVRKKEKKKPSKILPRVRVQEWNRIVWHCLVQYSNSYTFQSCHWWESGSIQSVCLFPKTDTNKAQIKPTRRSNNSTINKKKDYKTSTNKKRENSENKKNTYYFFYFVNKYSKDVLSLATLRLIAATSFHCLWHLPTFSLLHRHRISLYMFVF